MGLLIIHTHPNVGGSAAPSLAPVWKTCLRNVTFTDDTDVRPAEGDLLTDDAAYRLVLEILCGLHSPMIGETQVVGQFKRFLSGLDAEYAWLDRLGQRMLGDARRIRERHLRGLGSRSYGSAVRRHVLDCARVALVGTGALAQEIIPFVVDDGRGIDQWSRRSKDAEGGPGIRQCLLEDWAVCPVIGDPAALVVAAPVSSQDVSHVASRYSALRRVIDLRNDPEPGPMATAPIITLQTLFEQMQDARDAASAHVAAARLEIASLSRAFDLREQLRPFGWDDLCA